MLFSYPTSGNKAEVEIPSFEYTPPLTACAPDHMLTAIVSKAKKWICKLHSAIVGKILASK